MIHRSRLLCRLARDTTDSRVRHLDVARALLGLWRLGRLGRLWRFGPVRSRFAGDAVARLAPALGPGNGSVFFSARLRGPLLGLAPGARPGGGASLRGSALLARGGHLAEHGVAHRRSLVANGVGFVLVQILRVGGLLGGRRRGRRRGLLVRALETSARLLQRDRSQIGSFLLELLEPPRAHLRSAALGHAPHLIEPTAPDHVLGHGDGVFEVQNGVPPPVRHVHDLARVLNHV
mmetsp:Transcript_5540/g.22428  ORF Transcript_5540/g.22428 Transcript_5540/m.22428 type:complete len:234 (+) Transcript_5540:1152-1853(+)